MDFQDLMRRRFEDVIESAVGWRVGREVLGFEHDWQLPAGDLLGHGPIGAQRGARVAPERFRETTR
jgi:hypothetical protein